MPTKDTDDREKLLNELNELKNNIIKLKNKRQEIINYENKIKNAKDETIKHNETQQNELKKIQEELVKAQKTYEIIKNATKRPKEYRVHFSDILAGFLVPAIYPKIFLTINVLITIITAIFINVSVISKFVQIIITFIGLYIIEGIFSSVLYPLFDLHNKKRKFIYDKKTINPKYISALKKDKENLDKKIIEEQKQQEKEFAEYEKIFNEYLKEEKLMTNSITNKYGFLADENNWNDLDLIIKFIQSGRADTIKEALILVDTKKENDALRKTRKTAKRISRKFTCTTRTNKSNYK